MTGDKTPLLDIDGLSVAFYTQRGTVRAVRGISLQMDRGETVGIVGESGSGKSVTARAIMGLVELPGKITKGEILWKGESLLNGPNASKRARATRGKEMSMVFQDPMTSFNPLITIGAQIREVLRHHRGMTKKQANARAIELLGLVGMSNPAQRVDQYPHEFSGGMRQRAMIAMALACEPELLIADEPTTALDVTIQAQILELIAELQQQLGLAVILITHDLAVVAGVCDRVEVMYAGRFIERGTADEVFNNPGHPYTAGLLKATPRLDKIVPRLYAIEGSPPDLRFLFNACSFYPRCTIASEGCENCENELTIPRTGRGVACRSPFQSAALLGSEAFHE